VGKGDGAIWWLQLAFHWMGVVIWHAALVLDGGERDGLETEREKMMKMEMEEQGGFGLYRPRGEKRED